MNAELILIILIITALLLTLVGAGFLMWQMRAHYEARIAELAGQNLELLDRALMARGQPPASVSVRERYAQKQAERDGQPKNGEPRPVPLGPVHGARVEMEENRRRREGVSG